VEVAELQGAEREEYRAMPWWYDYREGIRSEHRSWDHLVRVGDEVVTDPRLAVALVFARLGLPVVRRPTDAPEAPGAGEVTTDVATIAGWWSRWPAADTVGTDGFCRSSAQDAVSEPRPIGPHGATIRPVPPARIRGDY
jgi:hypothetical protein